jgi:hypothetical protein
VDVGGMLNITWSLLKSLLTWSGGVVAKREMRCAFMCTKDVFGDGEAKDAAEELM